MLKREDSKKPNVYKVEIRTEKNIFETFYTSSLYKSEYYIEKWAEENLHDVNYEIEMSRLNIVDGVFSFGKLVDLGVIKIIDNESVFDIKVYKLNIL